jgi:two-component system sensor histidine kinase CiaH
MSSFVRARLRLTGWYMLVIGFVSLLFSLAIYRQQTLEIARFESMQRERIEARLNTLGPGRNRPILVISEDLIEEAKSRLLLRLGLANGVIIVLASGLGYLLAGRTLAPIEHAYKEQERFVGDASHELRTPLTVLRTNLEVFLRNKRPTLTGAKSLVQDSLGEVKRLEHLTNSLLTLSQPHSSSDDHQLVDLKPILHAVTARFASVAGGKGVKLTTRLTSVQVRGHEDELTSLFTALIDNAIKYAKKGKGKVSLSLTKSGKSVLVKIKDNGIGIGKHDLPHIFDRFYRADSARSKGGESGGYGLGLAIVEQIADAHHADLQVTSRVGQGTTFQLTFRSV